MYVADTEGHALREVDLRHKTVRTLVGCGIKGSDYRGGATGAAQLLNSPWDVVLDRCVLLLCGGSCGHLALLQCSLGHLLSNSAVPASCLPVSAI